MSGREITAKIAGEIYTALSKLEADPDLLSIIGSYGDTLSDNEILALLADYNSSGKIFHARH